MCLVNVLQHWSSGIAGGGLMVDSVRPVDNTMLAYQYMLYR